MDPDFKLPWKRIDPTVIANVAAELERELAPSHPLYSRDVIPVAIRIDCDDVLFAIDGGIGQFAVVHLTWTGKPEPIGWPETTFFGSLDQWVKECMMLDHDDYYTGETNSA